MALVSELRYLPLTQRAGNEKNDVVDHVAVPVEQRSPVDDMALIEHGVSLFLCVNRGAVSSTIRNPTPLCNRKWKHSRYVVQKCAQGFDSMIPKMAELYNQPASQFLVNHRHSNRRRFVLKEVPVVSRLQLKL